MTEALIAKWFEGLIDTIQDRLVAERDSEQTERVERTVISRLRLAARLGWAGLMLLSIGLFVISLPERYRQLHAFSFMPLPRSDILRSVEPEPLRAALETLGLSTAFFAWYSLALEITFAATFCTIAALIATRRANSWWTMFVVLMLVVFGTSSLPTITALSDVSPLVELLTRVTHMLGWALIEIFLFLFPNGRFVPRWTRVAAVVWLVWMLATAFFPHSLVSPFTWPDQLAFLLWTVWYGGAMLVQVYRFRHFANHVERLQTKWTMLSVVIAVVGTLAVNVPMIFASTFHIAGSDAVCELIRIPAGALFIMIMPVTVGIAILRYRLWEIDLLISRTLVYLPLTAILGGLYTASISLFQRLFVATTGNTSDVAIVLTTLVVASAFTPIKNALQSTVDGRFKPGGRESNQLSFYRQQLQSLVGLLDTQQATRHLLEASVVSLSARGGAVFLRCDRHLELQETAGDWQGVGEMTVSVPLEWEGERVGLVALGPKTTGETYDERDLEELRLAALNLAHLCLLRGAVQATTMPAIAQPA